MEKFLKSLLTIREIKLAIDDDCTDRLTRRYTVLILVCFAFLVTTKQFVGHPISCWCPTQFTDNHRYYAETICWVSNTYYLPLDQVIPVERLSPNSNQTMISYYKWVPFILMFQAVMSIIPSLVWRFFNKSSGIHLATIMGTARVTFQASYLEIREKAMRLIVNQLDRFLLAQRDHKTGRCIRVKHFVAKVCCLIGGRLYGSYLITAYLVVKVLYMVNAVGQLFFLDTFLGNNFHLYGINIVDRLVRGQDWAQSVRFPSVTLCEFEIRQQSRVHNYVVQCALSINLINETIFIFLWFWFVFLALINCVNFLKWLFRALYWPGQVHYVKRQLKEFDATHDDPTVLAQFTENYLRRDGIFIVRLIGLNMSEVLA